MLVTEKGGKYHGGIVFRKAKNGNLVLTRRCPETGYDRDYVGVNAIALQPHCALRGGLCSPSLGAHNKAFNVQRKEVFHKMMLCLMR